MVKYIKIGKYKYIPIIYACMHRQVCVYNM